MSFEYILAAATIAVYVVLGGAAGYFHAATWRLNRKIARVKAAPVEPWMLPPTERASGYRIAAERDESDPHMPAYRCPPNCNLCELVRIQIARDFLATISGPPCPLPPPRKVRK